MRNLAEIEAAMSRTSDPTTLKLLTEEYSNAYGNQFRTEDGRQLSIKDAPADFMRPVPQSAEKSTNDNGVFRKVVHTKSGKYLVLESYSVGGMDILEAHLRARGEL